MGGRLSRSSRGAWLANGTVVHCTIALLSLAVPSEDAGEGGSEGEASAGARAKPDGACGEASEVTPRRIGSQGRRTG